MPKQPKPQNTAEVRRLVLSYLGERKALAMAESAILGGINVDGHNLHASAVNSALKRLELDGYLVAQVAELAGGLRYQITEEGLAALAAV